MATANIELGKLKVQIDGSPEEISKILEGVREIERRRESREERSKLWRGEKSKLRKEKYGSKNAERNEAVHENKSLTETITRLIKRDYFNEPRTAREVLIRLERLGVDVLPTTLHPILARFVMKGVLRRDRNGSEVWEYKKDEGLKNE